MKRIITMIVILLVLASCSQLTGEVKISLVEKNPVEFGEINILVDNPRDQTIYFGNGIKLSTVVDNAEMFIPQINQQETLELNSLSRGVFTLTKDLSLLYGHLTGGTYTLTLPYSEDPSGKPVKEAKLTFTLADDNSSVLVGQVLYTDGQTALVYDPVSVGLFTMPNPDDYKAGSKIRVEYPMVFESYPAQITPDETNFIESNPTKMDLVLQLTEDLLNQLPSTIDNLKLEINGFDEKENQALFMVLQNKLNFLVNSMNPDDLDQKIDDNEAYMILDIEDNLAFKAEVFTSEMDGNSWEGHANPNGYHFDITYTTKNVPQ